MHGLPFRGQIADHLGDRLVRQGERHRPPFARPGPRRLVAVQRRRVLAGQQQLVILHVVALAGRRRTPQDRLRPGRVHLDQRQRLQQAGDLGGSADGPASQAGGRGRGRGLRAADGQLGQPAADGVGRLGRDGDRPAGRSRPRVSVRSGPCWPPVSEIWLQRVVEAHPYLPAFCSYDRCRRSDQSVGLSSTMVCRWTGRPQMELYVGQRVLRLVLIFQIFPLCSCRNSSSPRLR